MRSKATIHHFKAPVLSGPDGNPLEIPDSLALRLRRNALDPNPSGEEVAARLPHAFTGALFNAAREIAGRSVEHGVVISDEGLILFKKRGSADRVRIEDQLLRKANFLHNHPDGKPLSFEDIEALLKTGLNSVWAVGGGWLYGASIGPKGEDTSSGDFRLLSGYLSRAAFAVINDLFLHDPGIESTSLGTRHMHAVLSELAESGLVHYCRLRYGV